MAYIKVIGISTHLTRRYESVKSRLRGRVNVKKTM